MDESQPTKQIFYQRVQLRDMAEDVDEDLVEKKL